MSVNASLLISSVKRFLGESYTLLLPVPNRFYPYRCPGGRIYLNLKETPYMLLRALGLYELNKQRAICNLLQPGGTFIDAGANMGDFTILAASLVGPTGRVLAFEPEPGSCRWLRKSIARNGYANVRLYEAALSDANGMALLHLGKASEWHSLLPGRHNRSGVVVEVATRTLDSVLREIPACPATVIKIDVEGAELQVLQGASATLAQNRNLVLMIDLHPQLGINPLEVCAFLARVGFQIYELAYPYNRPARVDVRTMEILASRGVARLARGTPDG
jgi:FkbM family methyltransferase